MEGSYYFHVEKKKSGRELSEDPSAVHAEVLAMQLQESVPVSAMGNLWASLVQCTGDLEGPGQKGAVASLAIPTASDIWKSMGMTRKQRGKKQKWKRACRRLLQRVRKAPGSYMPLYMGSRLTPTANFYILTQMPLNSHLLPRYFSADGSVL